jgi:hypothetical protein
MVMVLDVHGRNRLHPTRSFLAHDRKVVYAQVVEVTQAMKPFGTINVKLTAYGEGEKLHMNLRSLCFRWAELVTIEVAE